MREAQLKITVAPHLPFLSFQDGGILDFIFIADQFLFRITFYVSSLHHIYGIIIVISIVSSLK